MSAHRGLWIAAVLLAVPVLAEAKGSHGGGGGGGGGGHSSGGGGHSSGGGGGGGHSSGGGGGGGGHSGGGGGAQSSGGGGGGHTGGGSSSSHTGGSLGGGSRLPGSSPSAGHHDHGTVTHGGHGSAGDVRHATVHRRPVRHHPRPGAASGVDLGGVDVSGIEYADSGEIIIEDDDDSISDDDDPPAADPVARFDPPDEPVPDCSHGMQGDYVGHRACKSRFGMWATPMRIAPMYLDWGMAARTLTVPPSATAVPLAAGSGLSLGRRLAASAITTNFRFGMTVAHGIYVGTELELGGVQSDGVRVAGGAAEPTNPLYVGGYLVTGVRGALGRFSLSTEIAAGGRSVQLQGVDKAGTQGTAPAIGQGVVEARVRAELWLSPWLSGGAVIGTSLVERDETMVGGFLSLHTRAFGGDRAR